MKTFHLPTVRRLGSRSLRSGFLLGLCCYVMSGASLFSQPLPLSACVVTVLPMGWRPILATVGAILGYFAHCDAAAAAEFTAVSLLSLAAVAVFQGTRLPSVRWFMPLLSAGVSAVLGGISVLGGEAGLSLLAVKILLSALAVSAFREAFDGNRLARTILTAVIVSGLTGIYPPLGLAAAAALCAIHGELRQAVILSLALDLTGKFGHCAMPALVLAVLFADHLEEKSLRLATFAVVPNVVFFCFGELSAFYALALLCGSAFCLAPERLAPKVVKQDNPQLREAAEILELLRQRLTGEPPAPETEADEVYDAAAERVCRCCPRFYRCWQQHARQTYRTLSQAAPRIIERGLAQREDFSKEFQEQCCHFEGFLLAINQELDGMLYRRRYRLQMRQSRQALSSQLGGIAEYLHRAQNPERVRRAAFVPHFGICSYGKQDTSGDRCACFPGTGTLYYILLCDGMGSGRTAAELSRETTAILRRLLQSGMSAKTALQLLNGTELLRRQSSYTTIDLLELELSGGTATLYKWGAAPSLLRHFDAVKQLGSPSPPPGVSFDDSPSTYSFCMKRAELLIMATDGADVQLLEQCLSAFEGTDPKELAALLVACADGQDDMTAVTVCLGS